MINFIGILILLFIEAILLWMFYKWNNERKEAEIDAMKLQITHLNEKIKFKNSQIKELQDELERKNNTRSRKNN